MIDKASFRDERIEGVSVVHVAGQLDIANDGDFRAEMRTRVAAAETFVAALHGVSYLDSQAIATLFDTAQRMALDGRTLLVVAPADRPVGKLLHIVGIDALVPTFDTVQDAVAHAKRLVATKG